MSELACVPPQKLMDEDALRQWILRRLGGLVHKVELCEEHVTDAVENARRWFAAKKGQRKFFTVYGLPNVVEYDLDCDIDRVIDVVFTAQKLDLSLIFSPFTLLEEKIPYDVFASGGSGGLYSSYVQSLQYVEMAKRILGAELEWYQEGQKLFIAPVPADARLMLVEAKLHSVQIECLSERDHDLVKRFALASAREDLAWIRGKFDSYPGAQGTISLDGDRLAEAARAEKELLNEEISASGYPMGFLTG